MAAKGFAPDTKFFALQKFEGMNTKATRAAIQDQQFSWLENWMPLGDGNLRTLWDKGTALYTAPTGKTIISFFAFNIASTSYFAVFLDDGTAVQVNKGTGATIDISATVGTFYASGGDLPGCAQWGKKYLLIVSTVAADAYWVWDGSLLYGAGTLAPEVTVTAGGSGYTSAPSVAASGGSGTGATFTASISGGAVTGVTITNPGSGYAEGDTVTLAFSGGGGTGAAATVTLMPFGVSGTALDSFLSRVWIANGAEVDYSAPDSFTDFSTSNGGGTITSTDSFLKYRYVNVKQASGFLYLFGDSSINVISNVQTTGSPATTTFNNSNTDPQIGTPWRDSVVAIERALVFANTSGIYAIYGGSAQKISDDLDNLLADANLSLTGISVPSAASATIFGVKVYIIQVEALDIFTSNYRHVLCIWDGKKWFLGSQSSAPIFIASQEIDSDLTAWGTDGSSLFQLFASASASLTKKAQGKLWAGSSPFIFKQCLGLYSQANDNTGKGFSLSVEVDTQNAYNTVSLTSAVSITFQNSSGGNLQFQNSSLGNLIFITAGTAIAGQGITQYGLLIGVTFSTTSEDATLALLAISYRDQTALA